MTDELRTFLDKAGMHIPLPMIQKCAEFCYALLAENQKVNLISRTTKQKDLLIKHVVDSVMGFSLLTESLRRTLKTAIDVGSGGGIPGMILAILTPDVSWTLLDATQKKMRACQNIACKLGLQNVTCMTGRSETLAHAKKLREYFDLATVRAVAPMAVILEYCLPFVRVGGAVLCYKGTTAVVKEELQHAAHALRVFGGGTPQIHSYLLPENAGERTIVLVPKIKSTPRDYPRAVGIPAKKPL